MPASNIFQNFAQGQQLAGQRELQQQQIEGNKLQRQQQFMQLDDQRKGAMFQDARTVNSFLKSGQPEQALNTLSNRLSFIEQFGGDPTDTREIADLIAQGDMQGATNLLDSVDQAGVQGGFLKDITPKTQKREAFQKGDKGLVFDPNTGSFTMDPTAKARFDELASTAVTQGGLDFKDRQGLNKDVTAIIKDTIGIRKAASELDKLKSRGTAASKLGAVFKFMKSLDPTSVVRESEQGQVYSAQGAGAQLAGQINGLLGEGKLTEAGFLDLVNTAKTIANSNITSTSTQVGSLLDTFENTIPQSFKEKVSARVPGLFEIQSTSTVTPAAPAAQQGFSSPSGIQFTVGG